MLQRATLESAAQSRPLPAALQDFIRSAEFPCVGAKAALARDSIEIFEGESLISSFSDARLHDQLARFGAALDFETALIQSFAAVFAGPRDLDERGFEKAMWARLAALHDIDDRKGIEWAEGVESDPASPDFSMSIAGQAFFVVGLHPNASRAARRFAYPTLIFNSHLQFEQLREDGRYELMQTKIRERDTELDGGINPMLDNFGDTSEARQYSGREVGEGWKCPFRPNTNTAK